MRPAPFRTALAALSLVGLALPLGMTAAPALAQTAAPFFAAPPAGTVRGSKIVGVPVIGMDHVRVGTIEDVLVDVTGRIQAVVIGVGGFLGVGEKYVAVPFDQLAWNTGDVSLTSGPSSVVRVGEAPSPDKAGPERMPGSQTDPAVLDAVDAQRSGRVDPATGPAAPERAPARPATELAGDTIVHAEVRLTKAQLSAAPAFAFKAE